MEPRIQYARTNDGVSIAYWTLGEGPPLVSVPWVPWSHIQLEWQSSEWRGWYEGLARGRQLIRFDCRGSGLSDREVADYSLDAYVTDLEAVADSLGIDSCVLIGMHHGGPLAIAYAARHPDRVSHLIVCSTYTRYSDYLQSSAQARAGRALIDEDWETYTETRAHFAAGWAAGQEAHRLANYMRETTTPQSAKAAYEAIDKFDVSASLPHVTSPTLLIHRREIRFLSVDVARRLAAKIPGARLALLEGGSVLPYVGDMDSILAAINEFLGVRKETAVAAGTPGHGDVHTILFTDIEGSTALTERLGDAGARELLREHERIVREALNSHGGSEVKTMGDGFMASFTSATRALECAIAMQRAFDAHNNPAQEPIHVRIGLNAGEPIAEDEDLFGTAVNEAARITAAAKGGEILVANVVRELAKGKDFLFTDRGETSLRGFEDPVRLFEVRWRP